MPSPAVISYLLAALAAVSVLSFHLLPAVFAGLAVHVLTIKLATRLPKHMSGVAHEVALGAIITVVTLGLFGLGFGLWSFLHGHHGMTTLLTAIAETLEKLKHTLPADVSAVLPDTVDALREQITPLLREHSQRISAAGMAGAKTFAHIILGMVVGSMTTLHYFNEVDNWTPFAAELHARSKALMEAFDKVVFAQVKISLLNTTLTLLYLLVILPLFGIHFPMLTILIPLTFITGLLPVVGNLVSNTAIVLISLGISPGIAVASLVFLIAIHKLEYFTNARIVGGEVHARAWELLCAMVVMEAIFGLAGLISAPVAYAWLKAELKAKGMI